MESVKDTKGDRCWECSPVWGEADGEDRLYVAVEDHSCSSCTKIPYTTNSIHTTRQNTQYTSFGGSFRELTRMQPTPRHPEIRQNTPPLNDPLGVIALGKWRHPIIAMWCQNWHWRRNFQMGGRQLGTHGLGGLLISITEFHWL